MSLENEPDFRAGRQSERLLRVGRQVDFEGCAAIDLSYGHHVTTSERLDSTFDDVTGAESLRVDRRNKNVASANGQSHAAADADA